MCKCIGNTQCSICKAALEKAFDEEYNKLKETGDEDLLEAKEFMWDFFAKRDEENVEDVSPDMMDESKWTY